LKVIKSLYDVSEARAHWFNTYHTHHKENLNMTKSTYICKSGFWRPMTAVTFAVFRHIRFTFVAIAQVLSEWNSIAAF
jgi:hypothetical protein